MKIYPRAEFQADFPSDYVEEGDNIVQFGGRGVANAICEMLRMAGLEVAEPEHQFEHGWDFRAIVDGRRIWVQVSDIGDNFVLSSEPNYMFFKASKKNRNAHVGSVQESEYTPKLALLEPGSARRRSPVSANQQSRAWNRPAGRA